MLNVDRATGRTYRKALQMCTLASHGKHVLFVGGCKGEIVAMLDWVEQLVPPGASVPAVGLDAKFPGGGKITFRLASACFTGGRYDAIIEDELLGLTWRQIEKYKQNIAGCGPVIGETL